MSAEDGTRTRYLQLGKLSLYQVSYFRLFSLGSTAADYQVSAAADPQDTMLRNRLKIGYPFNQPAVFNGL